MNAEYHQQLYGGEISDHFVRTNITNHNSENFNLNSNMDLGQVYSSQVKSKGSIDTSGLIGPNLNLNSMMVERPPDPFQTMLNNTFAKIAAEHGLGDESNTRTAVLPDIINPKNQTQDDIHHAQDAVAAALAELKDLGAL